MKTRHFLPALLVIAAASAAHAGLIYSGVQNVPVPLTLDGVYLSMSNGATTGSYPGDWGTAPWINPFFGGVDVANSDLLRPITTGAGQLVNLASGTVIDSTGNFVLGESGSSTHVGPAANQFQIGTPGILGFEFETTTGGPMYYGWLRMTVNNSGSGNIVDWAYDNAAGTPVQAGISSVPEPAAMLVGVSLCAVGMLRRRRGAA